MDRPTRGLKKMPFKGLKLAFDRMDHGDGRQGRAGNWEILLGGYDMGYEIYYQGKPIGRVNYELGEYELYLDDFISRSELPMFLDAIDASEFKNVHDHGDEETCLESKRKQTMKKLNITKEAFQKSRYFTRKYGRLEYVSESGNLFKTNKGKVLMFKESCDEEFDRYYERMKNIFRYDSGIHIRLRDNEDGSETIEVTFDDRYQWDDDVESGRIPLDKDARLEHWISRFDDAGHRYGWEFDYEIAKDIEHPIDGGANNDYLAMLTLTCKCDQEEDDLLFENSSESTDDMEKEFTYKGISITRYDYESLPSPMAASKLSDEKMQEIAKDIYFELVNIYGWDEKDIQKYVNNVDDYELTNAEMRIADKIRRDWWATMEDVGRFHGMEYYEDLPEDEM